MNKIISGVFAAALSLSAYSAIAATTPSRMMDTNNDGVVTKDEYMAYHDQAYDNMKQTDGGVSIKDMRSWIKSSYYRNSMNNKPIGTTTGVTHNGSTDDTKAGEPINGTHTGTNNQQQSSSFDLTEPVITRVANLDVVIKISNPCFLLPERNG